MSRASVVQFEVGMSLESFSIAGNVYTKARAPLLATWGVNRWLARSLSYQGGTAATPTNWSTTSRTSASKAT